MGNQGRILGDGRLRLSRCEFVRATGASGHDVICLDNLLTSTVDNIEHLGLGQLQIH